MFILYYYLSQFFVQYSINSPLLYMAFLWVLKDNRTDFLNHWCSTILILSLIHILPFQDHSNVLDFSPITEQEESIFIFFFSHFFSICQQTKYIYNQGIEICIEWMDGRFFWNAFNPQLLLNICILNRRNRSLQYSNCFHSNCCIWPLNITINQLYIATSIHNWIELWFYF